MILKILKEISLENVKNNFNLEVWHLLLLLRRMYSNVACFECNYICFNPLRISTDPGQERNRK